MGLTARATSSFGPALCSLPVCLSRIHGWHLGRLGAAPVEAARARDTPGDSPEVQTVQRGQPWSNRQRLTHGRQSSEPHELMVNTSRAGLAFFMHADGPGNHATGTPGPYWEDCDGIRSWPGCPHLPRLPPSNPQNICRDPARLRRRACRSPAALSASKYWECAPVSPWPAQNLGKTVPVPCPPLLHAQNPVRQAMHTI